MNLKPVLYLGDTSLANGAGYLAGLLTLFQLPFDYVPTSERATGQLFSGRKLIILSDYPSARMDDATQRQVVEAVEAGAGLLMIGGWESFGGLSGKWADTRLGKILPVNISRRDDRVNCDQPALVRCVSDHPIASGLPWDRRPPTVGGFNRLLPKEDATVVLEVERFTARYNKDESALRALDRHPLLVVGQHGQGRTAALATDLAPHWVGGLVDWGNGDRVTAEAPGSWPIEVGAHYAKFVRNLVSWTAQLSSKAKPKERKLVSARR